MEVIILAGGLGTRLQSVVTNIPKCMAPVKEKPFLWYLLKYLTRFEIDRITLSIGYLKEVIIDWINQFGNEFPFDFNYAIETEPLGTGGAIRLALEKCVSNNIIVLNGDTFFDIELDKLYRDHCLYSATITVALKPMKQFDRYGTVQIEKSTNLIKQFNEKVYCERGLINGGIYIINRENLDMKALPKKFSFETEILESQVIEEKIYGFIQKGYFTDIGIPQDYLKANEELPLLFKQIK